MSDTNEKSRLTQIWTLLSGYVGKIRGREPTDKPATTNIGNLEIGDFCDAFGNPLSAEEILQNSDLSLGYLDKFQVATSRLIDTIHGHFAGNTSPTTFDNARAVCTLVTDLAKSLQKRGLLSQEIDFSYSSKIVDIKHGNPHRAAINSSNYAKHADKDADQTHWYGYAHGVESLLRAMVNDYITLHCALLQKGLLACSHEKLYKIDIITLIQNSSYYELYDPGKFVKERPPIGHTDDGRPLYRLTRDELERANSKDAEVPAAAVACLIYLRWSRDAMPHQCKNSEDLLAQKTKFLRTLENTGIWPVQDKTNAMLIRHHAVVSRKNRKLQLDT